MSRASRQQKLVLKLQSLESYFQVTLAQELRACADSKWGMFGQNESLYEKLDERTMERY
jgi:hypothetical protein